MRAAIVAWWNGLSRFMRILIGFAGVLLAAVLGLSLVVAFSGGGSKSAAPTTTTTSTTPATPVPAPTGTTTTSTTTSTTPAPSPGTPTTTTTPTGPTGPPTVITTGGSSSVPATPGAPTAPSGKVTRHGLIVSLKFWGPIYDGGKVQFTLTVDKVSGPDIPNPLVGVTWNFDSGPLADFAVMDVPLGTIFSDQSKKWIQPGRWIVGSHFELSGTMHLPNRGRTQAFAYCAQPIVQAFSFNAARDASGNPKPNWVDGTGVLPKKCAAFVVS